MLGGSLIAFSLILSTIGKGTIFNYINLLSLVYWIESIVKVEDCVPTFIFIDKIKINKKFKKNSQHIPKKELTLN